MKNIDKILEVISGKEDKDIYILGKGASIDSFDLSPIKDSIVINTNDTELLIPGDICVFHHGWVLDVLEKNGAKAGLYISDRVLPVSYNNILTPYIPNTPENSEFLLNRFYSDDLYIESSIIVTALKIANQIAKALDVNKNVYLIGLMPVS